jgi:hypothetical protein
VFDAKVDENVYAHMEDISGLIGHYAHGNEPSHHVATCTTMPARRGRRSSA